MAATGGHFCWPAGAWPGSPRWLVMKCCSILIATLLLPACAPTPAAWRPAASVQTRADWQDQLLVAHNRVRTTAGVSPLTWDPVLAASAATYARQLALTGRLRHSPRQARPGQGENLWMGSRGAYPVGQMFAGWASERSAFRPGIFPAVSRTGNWSDVGHYSQVIWPATTRLGCAIASSPSYDFLVCRYAPAGNVDGRRVP